jgi:hypothetical protein
MIVCIEISQRTKDALETLLETGGYRSYSEAVAVAVGNQLLLQGQGQSSVKIAPFENVTKGAPTVEQSDGKLSLVQTHDVPQVPKLFSCLDPGIGIPRFAPYPDDPFVAGQRISVDQWIFGQHNKLLPVKATCRALARLMVGGKETLAFSKTVSEVVSEAVRLGDYLKHLDRTSGLHRDDALSFAFPYSDSPNGDKSRLRYANQFVVSVTKQDTLAGLPTELKLVNRDQTHSRQILLTEAGWLFAAMRNPVLDEGKNGGQDKFSDEEIQFLLAHIRRHVPAEAFAYTAVLKAIARGANTPDLLDDALDEYLPKREEKPFTRAFLTTQRAGVISRMIELSLVQRIRDGINVTYTATTNSLETSPNLLQKVVTR